jgi:hypothetical protein
VTDKFFDERSEQLINVTHIVNAVEDELARACAKYPKFTSAHEGYAILLEEVDELWDEVKKRPDVRDRERMRAEAIQIASTAMRFIMDICE